MRHVISRVLLPLLCAATALFVSPTNSLAGSYWWTGTTAAGQIAQGVNGFSWHMNGGSFNAYGSHCDARPAAYPSGSYCYLRWDVPANLTAGTPGNGGILYGRVRTANANFSLRTMRPGANPDYTSTLAGPLDMRDYSHGWGGLGAYVQTGIYTTAATTTSSTTNWFDVSEFAVVLHDPHNPGLNILSGHTGWKGPGGACIRYGYAEAGSGLQATALVNASTGAVHDNPSYASANVTTGVFQNDRNCVSIGALPTGHYTFRASAVDKSGNSVNNDFVMSFDTTVPAISAAKVGGTEVTNGRILRGSAGQYRPTFTFDYSDAHSGMATVAIHLDGVHVSNSASYTPASNLALGTHTITVVATDAVGNQATAVRTFSVVDDVVPTITLAEPGANGSNTPTLDVSAADDFSGVNPATWSVKVNGVQLPVSSSTARVQAAIGRLVNGDHEIEIRVRDHAGNERALTHTHTASGDTHTPPSLTGIHLLTTPATVYEGSEYRVVALATKDGRPIATGRFEVSKVGGDGTVLAGKNTNPDGSVDMLVPINGPGPLHVALPGSGLAPAPFTYTYHAKGTPPFCTIYPTDGACRSTTGTGSDGNGGSGSGTGTNGTSSSGSSGGNGATGTTSGTGSTNAGTSGGPNDKVAPKFTLKIVQQKKGVVRRTGVIRVRMTSNERANYTLQPIGSRTVKVSMTTKPRVLRIKLTGKLLKRIRAAKTPIVTVKVRVIGIDPNKNIVRKTITLRIRR